MTDIGEIRDGLAGALKTIAGLNVDAYMVDRVRAPHAMIELEIDYDLVLGGSKDVYPFTVMVFAQRDNVVQSQKLLDQLRDPNNAQSVKTVLEDGDLYTVTLDYVRVKRVNRPQVVTAGNPGVEYLLLEFEVEVVA